jgi:regulatory protein
MTITAIEPRRKGLCALYIDGEPAMKLDAEVLLSMRFDVGREISDEELHACVIASENKRCKDKAMWLISYRDHSRRELIDKLRRDYSNEAAEAAVSRCEELGLVDDGRFARRYAADLANLRRLSERGIRQKLREKGIDRDLIDEVVDELVIDEGDQIRTIIEKKYARSLSDEKGRRRAVSGLTRMGFAYSDIRAALAEYTEMEEEY